LFDADRNGHGNGDTNADGVVYADADAPTHIDCYGSADANDDANRADRNTECDGDGHVHADIDGVSNS
jgi:hypothetical protein